MTERNPTSTRRLTRARFRSNAQVGVRRVHDTTSAMCSRACEGGDRSLGEATRGLETLVESLAAAKRAAHARAEVQRAACEASERSLDAILKTAERNRRELCAEYAGVRARAERCLSTLDAASSNPESSKALRRAAAMRELADVFECVVAFSKGSKLLETACGGLFRDEMRMCEAVILARRSLALLDRAASYAGIRDNAGGEWIAIDAAGPALERFCENAENELLEQFARACDEKDYDVAAERADALFAFNHGGTAIARYVSSVDMFISLERLKEMDDLRANVAQSVADGHLSEAMVNSLRDFFAHLRLALTREYATTQSAFGSHGATAFNALVQRVAEQRMGAVVDAFLTAELRTVDSVRCRLSLTAIVLREISALNAEVSAATKAHPNVAIIDPDAYFGIGCESFLEDECACLDSSPTDEYVLDEAEVRAAGESAADAIFDGFVSAVARCESCLPASSLPLARQRMIEALFDRVLRICQLCLRRSINGTKSATAHFSPRASASDTSARCLEPVMTSTRYITAWLRSAHRVANGVRNTDADTDADALKGKTQRAYDVVLGALQPDMSQVFEVLATRVIDFVDATFRELQMHSDFNTDDASSFTHGVTDACTRVKALLNAVKSASRSLLEPANANALLTEIGERFYACALKNIRRYRYSAIGGVRLKLDLNEYAHWMRDAVPDRACVARFEAFSQRANVLVVHDDATESLVRDLELDADDEGGAEIAMLRKLRLVAVRGEHERKP